eukprot:scaffold224988_cov13-Prasinocladus_malaysianus.AAC.1
MVKHTDVIAPKLKYNGDFVRVDVIQVACKSALSFHSQVDAQSSLNCYAFNSQMIYEDKRTTVSCRR